MLTHELNNFTMSEAIKFYPQLKAAFKVSFNPLVAFLVHHSLLMHVSRVLVSFH